MDQQPAAEDSCMESSGIFTDVENRGDDDLVSQRHGPDSDLSPDGSTDTIKSNNAEYSKKTGTQLPTSEANAHSMSNSTASIANISCERGGDCQSSVISDASIGSIQSCTIVSGTAVDSNLHTSKSKKTSPSRKQNKNEANVALKKHEMSKRGVGKITTKLQSSSTGGSDSENQENRRPPVISANGRKNVPNKWDAVMNKIALNKTASKTTNYSEVKSKVTCGLSRRNSPKFLKSPDGQQSPASSKRSVSSAKR